MFLQGRSVPKVDRPKVVKVVLVECCESCFAADESIAIYSETGAINLECCEVADAMQKKHREGQASTTSQTPETFSRSQLQGWVRLRTHAKSCSPVSLQHRENPDRCWHLDHDLVGLAGYDGSVMAP